jgi:hypothetical protein
MKLYIDESGNTGETLSQDGNFNFVEQPFYVLSGLLVNDTAKVALEAFVSQLKVKYHIQGNELKSKGIYKSKSNFLKELVDYLTDKKIPVFTELMDKLYYIHTQLIEYFIVPYYSLEFNDLNIEKKRIISAELGKFLNQDIYDKFLIAIKMNSNESLEEFYEVLINHFDAINEEELKKNVQLTKEDYFDEKSINPVSALRKFFPIPDENPNNRLIHLLPNYNAFTNLIGRVQKYVIDFTSKDYFDIIHDEQKQFDVIYKKTIQSMKQLNLDSIVEHTKLASKGTFNLNENISLTFIDSKTDISIQVADLLSGFIMRFWLDFKNNNNDNVEKYLPLMIKLNHPFPGSSIGINYVVPYYDLKDITKRMIQASMSKNSL